MSGAKEVKNKIASVQSTKKITGAMEMVAASKMRKAQDRMKLGKPYAERIRNVVAHLARANPQYKHPYMQEREPKRVGYIVITTDRGLCGGLNANLLKQVVRDSKQWTDRGVETRYCLIGNKGQAFFNSVGGHVVASTSGLGERPHMEDLIGSIKVMLDAFENEEIDRLYLVYNEFVNTMVQQPRIQQLLPLEPFEEEEEQSRYPWDYLYEPAPEVLIDGLLVRFIESQVYQGVVENNACEQSARMIAMKAATDNATEIIDDLQTLYNKARQAAITQEISEIVSGAAAV